MSWAMAERALRDVGNASAGEWRERGHSGIMHIRRRLTDAERRTAGGGGLLEVRDIRGTAEERRRIRQLLAEAPHLRGMFA